MNSQGIRYMKRREIDPARWDAGIDAAANGLIYAYSFYLDHMASHWDGLVYGDYEYLMPVTWNRKWGIRYLHQPACCASLGIFGNHITHSIVLDFIRRIPSRFRLIEIDLNAGNYFPGTGELTMIRNNYVLNLQKGYAAIREGYRSNTRRNILRCEDAGLIYSAGLPVEEVIYLSGKKSRDITGMSPADYGHFKELFAFLQKKGMAVSCGVRDLEGRLLSSAVFFFSHNRAYYVLVGNHPEGKKLGASHFLVDHFIQANAGQKMLLDFEGSDIEGLAFFYSGFGAELEHYPAMRVNRLPWWANRIRKMLKG